MDMYDDNSKFTQQDCRVNPDIPCENCQEMESCPFLFCQHTNCMNCKQRYMCSVCHGDCLKCEFSTLCRICANKC